MLCSLLSVGARWLIFESLELCLASCTLFLHLYQWRTSALSQVPHPIPDRAHIRSAVIPNRGLVTGQLNRISALLLCPPLFLFVFKCIERSSPMAAPAPCLNIPRTMVAHLRTSGSSNQGIPLPHRVYPFLFAVHWELYTEIFLVSLAHEEQHFLRLLTLFPLTRLLHQSHTSNPGQTLTTIFPYPRANTSLSPQVLTFHSITSSQTRRRLLSIVNSITRLVCPRRP